MTAQYLGVGAMPVHSNLRRLIYRRQADTGKKESQETIAQKTGLSQPTISAWMDEEREIENLNTRAWVALARYLDVDPCELLRFED